MASDNSDPTLFVPPVRMRVGDSIGLIRGVSDALDWIDHLRGTPRQRFEQAAILLRQAVRSRSREDVAEAKSMFVDALFSADLLYKQPSQEPQSPSAWRS